MIHPCQPLNLIRLLVVVFVFLSALLPAETFASIPRQPSAATTLPLSPALTADSVLDYGSVSLSLGFDDPYDGGVLVRQNPWTKFDPEGLYSWGEFRNDADAVVGGAVQGFGEANGGSTCNRPQQAPGTYRVGLAVGHALGLAQGVGEIGGGSAAAQSGAALAAGGVGAIAATGGAALPVGGAAVVGGTALVVGGAAVAAHGTAVAGNSLGLLLKDAKDAVSGSGGSPEGTSARKAAEKNAGQTAEGGRKRVEDMTREERIEYFTKEKGVPKEQLGPSGYPKEHTVVHPNRKSAKDAARQEGQSAPEHHASDAGQDPHYHATDSSGEKLTGPDKGAHQSYKKKHQ